MGELITDRIRRNAAELKLHGIAENRRRADRPRRSRQARLPRVP